MKIHEYQGKEILRQFNVPVPRGIPAFTVQEAVEAAQKLGGPVWVVKAQIHAGGRGKGGGVKLARSIDEVKQLATEILGMQLITHQTGPLGQKVRRLLIEDGADIIELGAESTKPFSSPVSAELQLEKLLPILKLIKEKEIKIPISVDTRSAKVAQKCVEAGADIINDVSGLEYDELMAETVARLNVPIIIQHSKGTPENMQINPTYTNLMDEIFIKLKNTTDFAIKNGIKPENIIIDAGIGFGKTKEQNFEIIHRVEELCALNYPVMLGISRKNLLGITDQSNEAKDIFTLALNSTIMDKKVNFIRVHNVKLHTHLLKLK